MIKTIWMLFRNEMTARKDKNQWLKRHKKCHKFQLRKRWKWKIEVRVFRKSSKCRIVQGIIIGDPDRCAPLATCDVSVRSLFPQVERMGLIYQAARGKHQGIFYWSILNGERRNKMHRCRENISSQLYDMEGHIESN